MIIEWNAHMFSSDTERYPFHPSAKYVPDSSRWEADPLAAYLKRMEDEGIDRAVLVHPEPYGDDHRLALDCVARRPDLFRTTALFFPKDPEAPKKLKRFLSEHAGTVVAHRFHAHQTQRTYLDSFDDKTVRDLWVVAGEAGVFNELHIDSEYAAQVDKLASRYPEFPVLIDHLAEARLNPAPQFANVIRLARHKNVYMKLSGIDHFATDSPLYESAMPFTRWVADAFGPDRLVWGSGTPKIVDAHLSHWSDADRAKVKGGNLKRSLGF